MDALVDPPDLALLNRWRGPQRPGFAVPTDSDLPYEIQIARCGQVPTRPGNWHDAFNALCWLAWPLCKRAINQAHCAILDAGGDDERRNRSLARDVLTLFDEAGAVVLSSDPGLFKALRSGNWQQLFVEQRERVQRNARLLLLGHAVLDDLRAPRLNSTSKCLLFEVDEALIKGPTEELRAAADQLAAARLAQFKDLGRARQYPPLPIMGWPGWYRENDGPSFYADHPDVFRPRNALALAQTF